MKNLESKGEETEIHLNKDFYPKKSIKDTENAFTNNYNVEIEENEKEFVVNLSARNGKTSEKAGYQFLNYLLSIIKKDGAKKRL